MTLKEIQERIEFRMKELCDMDKNTAGPVDWVLSSSDEAIDSVMALGLVLAIEQEFGIVVSDQDICPGNFRSLDALASLVHKIMNS